MQDPLIQDAMNEIDKFFMDDAAYMSYINRQAAILDYNSGMNASREEGLKKGLKEGLKEGLEKGLEKGEDKLSRLFLALSNAGRQNEFAQACSDKTLREKLYKEFNIE